MGHPQLKSVPVRSYAETETRPRFGIRSQCMTVGDLPVHRHDYFEVLFFIEGKAPQRISTREHSARRGTIFFIAPMTPHQARFNAADTCYVLYFDLAFLRPDIAAAPGEIDADLLARVPHLAPFAYQDQIDYVLAEPDIDLLKSLCDRMLAERGSPRLCSAEIVRAHLVLLLAEITRRYEDRIGALMREQPPGGGGGRRVKGAVNFITAHLGEKIQLADAARKVAVSPNYLASLLKRETGKTFGELVTEKRMERARELLTFTELRVSQVAEAAGYDDYDYFCRRFKQIAGCTPLEFRARHAIASVRRLAPARLHGTHDAD